ncbi:MAG TPA: ribosome biogenesis factor YjgA [Woeseiaceae bacterium]|nr:ribosome biogenesis factor YjgA [Woeseiaceae bacterium]
MQTKPSKSARKRAHHALQALGERLVSLTDEQLAALPLDDALRDAVLLARRTRSHGALRRQRQLIGKLMTRADADTIREALAAIDRGHRNETRLLHDAEAWRERLARDGAAAVDEFAALTGYRNSALAGLVEALPRSPTAALLRRNRRQLFRLVLADLEAKVQNGDR